MRERSALSTTAQASLRPEDLEDLNDPSINQAVSVMAVSTILHGPLLEQKQLMDCSSFASP
jgi:hypothetical protein